MEVYTITSNSCINGEAIYQIEGVFYTAEKANEIAEELAKNIAETYEKYYKLKVDKCFCGEDDCLCITIDDDTVTFFPNCEVTIEVEKFKVE